MISLTEVNLADQLARLVVDHRPHGRARVVSALTLRGHVWAYGFNKKKTHPLQQQLGGPLHPYLHAEVDMLVKAINRLGRRLDDWEWTTIVVRVTADGHGALAKPCKGCRDGLRKFGLHRVLYSTAFGLEEMRV